jgi:hypothetical protein
MPSGSATKVVKQKPSDVAAETKRTYTPYIKANFEAQWPTCSYLFEHPIVQCAQRFLDVRSPSLGPPQFCKSDRVHKPTNHSMAHTTSTRLSLPTYQGGFSLHKCNHVRHAKRLRQRHDTAILHYTPCLDACTNIFFHPMTDVQTADPVDAAISWGRAANSTIPVICAANDKRAGGDWETGVQGYEERLCRRSTLACCLGTPAPNAGTTNNFPIPSSGGIYSSHVGKFHLTPHCMVRIKARSVVP